MLEFHIKMKRFKKKKKDIVKLTKYSWASHDCGKKI